MTTAASAVDTPAIEKSPKWWKAIGQRRERVTSMMAATTNTLTSGVLVAMGDNGDRGATTTTMMEKGGLHPTSRTTATSGAKTTLVTTPFPPSHPGLPQFVIQMRLLFYHGYYSFQFNRFFWGISPAGGGIYPSARGINLDLCLCTIPTVGFYGKIGKITATHHQNIKHIHGDAAAALRRLYRHEPPLSSPAVARRRRCPPAAASCGSRSTCGRDSSRLCARSP